MFSHTLVADGRHIAQNGLSFGQTTLKYILKELLSNSRVLTVYLVHLKAKSRLQRVARIFKSQICYVTHVSWSTLAQACAVSFINRNGPSAD